jgi:hypothetical protein
METQSFQTDRRCQNEVKQDLEVNKIDHWKRQAKIENEWNWIIEHA